MGFLLVIVLLYTTRSDAGKGGESYDAIVVLAGGVRDETGAPHETVMRRLQAAAEVYQQQVLRTGVAPAVICNGGGTTHKPKWVDKAGYAVPEAALMGRELIAMGIKSRDVYIEGYSDDTLGLYYSAPNLWLSARVP